MAMGRRALYHRWQELGGSEESQTNFNLEDSAVGSSRINGILLHPCSSGAT
jgi:hypothetical protein